VADGLEAAEGLLGEARRAALAGGGVSVEPVGLALDGAEGRRLDALTALRVGAHELHGEGPALAVVAWRPRALEPRGDAALRAQAAHELRGREDVLHRTRRREQELDRHPRVTSLGNSARASASRPSRPPCSRST